MPEGWSDYVPIFTGFVRAVLAALGGVGFTWALTVNASQVQMAVSAAMMLAAAGWSAWQKLEALRALKAAAKAAPTDARPVLPS